MAKSIIMPRQGQSVESCIITEWHKKKGEQINKGDVLFSYETDKASFDHEAEEEGILLDTFFEEGDEVPVLTNVAVVGEPGESAAAFQPGSNEQEAKESSQSSEETEKTKTTGNTVEEAGISPANDDNKKIKISPLAKKQAEKNGIDYQQIQGSGPYGRIISRDIEKAMEQSKDSAAAKQIAAEKTAPAQTITMSAAPASGSQNIIYGEDHRIKKLSNIRKIIARGMQASLNNSAQLTHHTSADARNILELRKKIKTRKEKGESLANITLNDMISFAVIKALTKHPDANSHFLSQEESIKSFSKVHLGFAVDTERGLMVPVIKNSDDLTLSGLSSQLKALADQCKKGSIDPSFINSEAASFTISNLGAYGIEMFTPVINLPQVGILGVNTIINRPAEMGNGTFGFIPYIGLSLTYDHRALDGGPASLFLKTIKEEVENFNSPEFS